MRLDHTEYGLGVLPTTAGFTDAIIISKQALEEWRDHYLKVSREEPDPWRAFYSGKADVLTEILKHFEEEENEF